MEQHREENFRSLAINANFGEIILTNTFRLGSKLPIKNLCHILEGKKTEKLNKK